MGNKKKLKAEGGKKFRQLFSMTRLLRPCE